MKELTTYDFDGNPVRVVPDGEGDPWFVATDVAKVLGYRNAPDMTRRLDPEDITTHSTRSIPGHTPQRGNPNVTIINEPGLYDAIFGSRVPAARRFQRWVTHEVLPAIRRTGRYDADTAELAAIGKALTAPGRLYSLAEAAQLLAANGVRTKTGKPLGQNVLSRWLNAEGTYLVRVDWGAVKDDGAVRGYRPFQSRVDAGLMELASVYPQYSNNSGDFLWTQYVTKFTGKGLVHLLKKYAGLSAAEATKAANTFIAENP